MEEKDCNKNVRKHAISYIRIVEEKNNYVTEI